MFENELQFQEELLWQGRPNLTADIKTGRKRALMLVCGLLLGAALMLLGLMTSSGLRDPLNFVTSIGAGLMLVSAAWYGIVSVTRPSPARRGRHSSYAVTDRRILIRRKKKLSQYGLNEVQIALKTLGDGKKAIILYDNEYDGTARSSHTLPSVGGIYYAGADSGVGNMSNRLGPNAGNTGVKMGAALGATEHGDHQLAGALGAIYAVDGIEEVEKLIRQAQKNAKNSSIR